MDFIATELEASRLDTQLSEDLKPVPPPDGIASLTGSCTTDHMLTVSWSDKKGWNAPLIRPYGTINLLPTASCLHYATECFEGLRVYRGFDNKVRLFRPERNASRFLRSSLRISLPSFSTGQFLQLLNAFVNVEAERWLPEPGRCAYIRPTMIGTGDAIGMSKPADAMMIIFMVLIPTMTNGQTSQTGMKLWASKSDSIRAWPGGFGSHKVGANYGPTILSQTEAASRGYHQVLWLYGEEGEITEAGACNLFSIIKPREGGILELVTPTLDEGLILDGVTRASVLDLAAKMENITVVERQLTMQELIDAGMEGRLIEVFVTGTAYFLMSVREIHHRGRDLVLPLAEAGGMEKPSRTYYADSIRKQLKNIMYGNTVSDWAVEVESAASTTGNRQ